MPEAIFKNCCFFLYMYIHTPSSLEKYHSRDELISKTIVGCGWVWCHAFYSSIQHQIPGSWTILCECVAYYSNVFIVAHFPALPLPINFCSSPTFILPDLNVTNTSWLILPIGSSFFNPLNSYRFLWYFISHYSLSCSLCLSYLYKRAYVILPGILLFCIFKFPVCLIIYLSHFYCTPCCRQ